MLTEFHLHRQTREGIQELSPGEGGMIPLKACAYDNIEYSQSGRTGIQGFKCCIEIKFLADFRRHILTLQALYAS